jgi:S1-C subfamily serine protease
VPTKFTTLLAIGAVAFYVHAADAPVWSYSTVAVCTVKKMPFHASLVSETTAIGTATLISDGRHVYAATARHVVRGMDSVYLSFRLRDGRTALTKIGGTQRYNFIFPEDTMLDLSLTVVEPPVGAAASVFDVTTFASTAELVPGSQVRVVGFPVSVGVSYTMPFLKFGMISASPDSTGHYYIDSNVFPGNSGGAVIIPPGEGTMQPNGLLITNRSAVPRLAGIVLGYLTYNDVAVSVQTKQPRVVFSENSGITKVVTPQALLRFLKNRK